MILSGLERNLGAGVPRPDHEHVAVLQRGRIAVLSRAQLHDLRVQLLREGRYLRYLVRAGTDDHLVGMDLRPADR